LPNQFTGFTRRSGQFGHRLVERIVLSGQQRAVCRRALQGLRYRNLVVLQQRQHRFKLLWRKLAQRRLTKLLANKVANRLAVVTLTEQFRQLRDNLAGGVILRGGIQTLVEILLCRREMA
jgi:predicted alpha-1,6-mannanase (GH76 family)